MHLINFLQNIYNNMTLQHLPDTKNITALTKTMNYFTIH
jgi:hypothetical protein